MAGLSCSETVWQKPYSPMERRIALDMYKSGLIPREICQNLGIASKSTITNWVNKAGLTRKSPKKNRYLRWTRELYFQCIWLYLRGLTVKEIKRDWLIDVNLGFISRTITKCQWVGR